MSYRSMASSADEAASARAAMSKSHPDMMWLPVVGLDRHTPLIGLHVAQTLTATRACARPGRRASRRSIGRSAAVTTTDAAADKP